MKSFTKKMSSRAATREYSNFLVRYDDATYYTCSRVKILTDGHVCIGEKYQVVYGTSTNDPEFATILETGSYIDLKKQQTELEQQENQPSPPESPPASPQTTPSPPRKRKKEQTYNNTTKSRPAANLLCIVKGNNDLYQYRSPSPQLPAYLSAPMPPSPCFTKAE